MLWQESTGALLNSTFLNPGHPNEILLAATFGRGDVAVRVAIKIDITTGQLATVVDAVNAVPKGVRNGEIHKLAVEHIFAIISLEDPGTAQASKSCFGKAVCETIVAGDINGDCKVDFADFTIMAFHWRGNNKL